MKALEFFKRKCFLHRWDQRDYLWYSWPHELILYWKICKALSSCCKRSVWFPLIHLLTIHWTFNDLCRELLKAKGAWDVNDQCARFDTIKSRSISVGTTCIGHWCQKGPFWFLPRPDIRRHSENPIKIPVVATSNMYGEIWWYHLEMQTQTKSDRLVGRSKLEVVYGCQDIYFEIKKIPIKISYSN